MSIKFDANGNIDPSSLEKDLIVALDSDVKYKQVDNMKKRAIRISKSYDEFKAMVACAHLKTVSREDIESLKAVKKGWKNQSSKSSATASILAVDTKIDSSGAVSMTPDVGRVKKPKTSFEFERNWRRLGTPEKKYE